MHGNVRLRLERPLLAIPEDVLAVLQVAPPPGLSLTHTPPPGLSLTHPRSCSRRRCRGPAR